MAQLVNVVQRKRKSYQARSSAPESDYHSLYRFTKENVHSDVSAEMKFLSHLLINSLPHSVQFVHDMNPSSS